MYSFAFVVFRYRSLNLCYSSDSRTVRQHPSGFRRAPLTMSEPQLKARTSRSWIAVLCCLLLTLLALRVILYRDEIIALVRFQYLDLIIVRRRVDDVDKCLRSEFAGYGSELLSVKASFALGSRNVSGPVLLSAANAGYRFAGLWMKLRRAEGTPFVTFATGPRMRRGELSPNYARLPAVLASITCLPNIRRFVYTDMDTLVDLRVIDTLANETSRPFTISWKKGYNGTEKRVLRTNWFSITNGRNDAVHLLRTWFYNGRKSMYEDQDVLNDLYVKKKWLRDDVQALFLDQLRGAERNHCYSATVNRTDCMRSLTFARWGHAPV